MGSINGDVDEESGLIVSESNNVMLTATDATEANSNFDGESIMTNNHLKDKDTLEYRTMISTSPENISFEEPLNENSLVNNNIAMMASEGSSVKRARKSPVDYRMLAINFKAPEFYISPDLPPSTKKREKNQMLVSSLKGARGRPPMLKRTLKNLSDDSDKDSPCSGKKQLKNSKGSLKGKRLSLSHKIADDSDVEAMPLEAETPIKKRFPLDDMTVLKENVLTQAILSIKQEQARFPPTG